MVAAVDGVLASPAHALAVESAPIRVNVISPCWVDTPSWDTVAGGGKAVALDAMAKRLLVGRVSRPDDVARAFLALMRGGFVRNRAACDGATARREDEAERAVGHPRGRLR